MQFPLGTVLSVTTGINLAPAGFVDVCALLDHMTGDALTDMGRAMMQPACKRALLSQHPNLADVEPPAGVDLPLWLANEAERLGAAFDVQPLAA